MILPVIINRQNKWKSFIAIIACIWLLYLFTNHWPVANPQHLQPAWVDQNMPFLPLSVWIYLTYFFIFILAYGCEQDEIFLNKYLYALVAANLVSNLFFIFVPITYMRDYHGLILQSDPLTQICFKVMYIFDSPKNCFPSLHVSMAVLSALLWFKRNKLFFIIFFIWASLIAFSTLTTKQHYFWDVLGGSLLAILCYYCFFHLFSYRPAEP